MKRLTLFFLSLLIASSSLFVAQDLTTQTVEASHATFDKTFLIDDPLFVDSDSMSVAQIQSFLEAEGNLLANWTDSIDMRRPSDNCIVHHATDMTAAEIIYEAANGWNAQVYNSSGCAVEGAYWGDPGYSNYTLETVSPKALLVMLQKEQSLISANGTYSSSYQDYQDPACCSSNEYKLARAMGYGVPDSAGINEKYLGFYNQLNWGAWQLRFNFERSAGNTAWDGVSYITYSGPMIEGTFSRCGTCSAESFDGYYPIDGSPIYMGSRGTASLYYYTPHTYPGFYGNYNFVQFYTDWFGPVDNPQYKAAVISQGSTKKVVQGQRKLTWVRLQNTGNQTWYDTSSIGTAPSGTSPTQLVATKPFLHDSKWSADWGSTSVANTSFNKVWGSNGTTVAANQHIVKPGHIVQINFFVSTDDITIPTGTYSEWLRLANVDGTIIEPSFQFSVDHLQRSYEAELIRHDANKTVVLGERELSSVRFKNTGNTNWYDENATLPTGESEIRLITTKPVQNSSAFGAYWGVGKDIPQTVFSKVYKSNGTSLAANQSVVRPGEIAKIDYFLDASGSGLSAGNYDEWFRLQKSDGTIIMPAYKTSISLVDPVYSATLVKKDSPDTVVLNDRTLSWVRFKNTGNTVWYDDIAVNGDGSNPGYAPSGADPIRLISTKPVLNSSTWGVEWGPSRNVPNTVFGKVFKTNGALSSYPNRVLPGETVQINFFMSTDDGSLSAGSYSDWIRLARTTGTIIQPAVEVPIILELP